MDDMRHTQLFDLVNDPQETKNLADTRGERNDDFEHELDKMKQHQFKQDGKIELLMSNKFNALITELRLEIHRLKEIK